MYTKINDIEDLILRKQMQLMQAKNEREAWNSGKYKAGSNAKASHVYVESLEREIEELNIKLKDAMEK